MDPFGPVIDKGGAAMRERNRIQDSAVEDFKRRIKRMKEPRDPVRLVPVRQPAESSIVVDVVETHDGVECDCIDHEAQEMTLRVGDTIELTHTCHDGRVDIVKATIREINLPTEHAKVKVKRGS